MLYACFTLCTKDELVDVVSLPSICFSVGGIVVVAGCLCKLPTKFILSDGRQLGNLCSLAVWLRDSPFMRCGRVINICRVGFTFFPSTSHMLQPNSHFRFLHISSSGTFSTASSRVTWVCASRMRWHSFQARKRPKATPQQPHNSGVRENVVQKCYEGRKGFIWHSRIMCRNNVKDRAVYAAYIYTFPQYLRVTKYVSPQWGRMCIWMSKMRGATEFTSSNR